GRRREFAHFSSHRDEEGVPDPNARETFEQSRLDWDVSRSPQGKEHLARFQRLLDLRSRYIVPLLAEAEGHAGRILAVEEGVIAVDWTLGQSVLELRCN